MRNAQGQIDLLPEGRDPIGTRQYALARERGQDDKQKMNNNKRNNIDTNPIGTTEVRYVHHNNIQKRTGNLPTPKTGTIPDCWKCGYKFLCGHLISFPAKTKFMQNLQENRPLR